jgi:hypothetical protein
VPFGLRPVSAAAASYSPGRPPRPSAIRTLQYLGDGGSSTEEDEPADSATATGESAGSGGGESPRQATPTDARRFVDMLVSELMDACDLAGIAIGSHAYMCAALAAASQ